MGRIDQPIDFLAHHKSGKPGRAAEPADANLPGYRAGMAGAPGQRGGDTHALAEARQCAARQCRRFAGAAENEEMAGAHDSVPTRARKSPVRSTIANSTAVAPLKVASATSRACRATASASAARRLPASSRIAPALSASAAAARVA